MNTANRQFRETHARYKRNFNVQLRQTHDVVSLGDLMFVKETMVGHPHILASVASDSYPIVEVDTHTLTTQRFDQLVGNSFRQRIAKISPSHI